MDACTTYPLRCWGGDEKGQLGVGIAVPSGGPSVVSFDD